MALGFYEKVVVVRSDKFPEYLGRTGYVLGISEEDGVVFAYAVSFLGEVETCCFDADELNGTGEFANRSLFYDDLDPPLRVSVKHGEGYIADKSRDED